VRRDGEGRDDGDAPEAREDSEPGGGPSPSLSWPGCFVWMTILTLGIALLSQWIVDAIEVRARRRVRGRAYRRTPYRKYTRMMMDWVKRARCARVAPARLRLGLHQRQ
jgi:hypothetical protein